MSIPTNPAEPDTPEPGYGNAMEVAAWKAGYREGAQAKPAEAEPVGYATRLAEAIWQKHYASTAPDWKPLPDLLGVLTQIDNMTSGLVSPQPAEVPALTDEPPRPLTAEEVKQLARYLGWQDEFAKRACLGQFASAVEAEHGIGPMTPLVRRAALAPQLAGPPNAEAQPVTSDARTGLPLSWVAFCPHCERPLTITPKRAEQLALKEGGEE